MEILKRAIKMLFLFLMDIRQKLDDFLRYENARTAFFHRGLHNSTLVNVKEGKRITMIEVRDQRNARRFDPRIIAAARKVHSSGNG